MKVIILTIVTFLFIAACNDGATNNDTDIKQITATINGTKFSADNILIAEEFGTHLKKLKIFGSKDTDSISIFLHFEPSDSIKTGVYNITKNGYFQAIYNHSGNADTATEGVVNLDKYEGPNPVKASGSFNFVIKQGNTITYSINNGIFNTGK